MSQPTKTPAAARADQLAERTRKVRHFEEMESATESQKPSSLTMAPTFSSPTANKFLSYLGSRNPFGKPVTDDDVVWLLDNTAFQAPYGYGGVAGGGPWQAEFVAAVFGRDARPKETDMVTTVAKLLGLNDNETEKRTIERRMLPFMWEIRPSRKMRVEHQGKQLHLGPTGPNGISSDVISLPPQPEGTAVTGSAVVSRNAIGVLKMTTYFAGPEGWAVISDIDDTIKITKSSDPLGVYRNTLVDPPKIVPGMPELYAHIKATLPRESPWFYVSASPYNLYPFLRDFVHQSFPPGTLILRDGSWRTIAGLLGALTLGTAEYKTSRIRKVHSWLPKRKMILIGDSTQSDPEAYGDIYREHKGWIKLMLIRKVKDLEATGIEEKNEPARFEEAFKDVPRDAWYVFEDPAECNEIVTKVLARG